MARLKSELEVACPCCHAVLVIDTNLGRFGGEDAVRVAQLRFVGALRLLVRDHATEIGVDHEDGVAAGARHFDLRFQPGHQRFSPKAPSSPPT